MEKSRRAQLMRDLRAALQQATLRVGNTGRTYRLIELIETVALCQVLLEDDGADPVHTERLQVMVDMVTSEHPEVYPILKELKPIDISEGELTEWFMRGGM